MSDATTSKYDPTKYAHVKLTPEKIALVENNSESLIKLDKNSLQLLCEVLKVPFVKYHTIADSVNKILQVKSLDFAEARKYLETHHQVAVAKPTKPATKRKAAPATLPPSKKQRLESNPTSGTQQTAAELVQALQGNKELDEALKRIVGFEKTILTLQAQLQETQEKLAHVQAAPMLTHEQKLWLDFAEGVKLSCNTVIARIAKTPSDAKPSDITHYIELPDKKLPVTQEQFMEIKNAGSLRRCARVLAQIAHLDLQNGCLKASKEDLLNGKVPWNNDIIVALVKFASRNAAHLISKGFVGTKLRAAIGDLATIVRKSTKFSGSPVDASESENEE